MQVMIAEGDGGSTFATTGQSDNLLRDVSKMTDEQWSDMSHCSVDIEKEVADIVDNIVVSVAAADDVVPTCATNMTCVTSDHESTHLCSTIVSASSAHIVDDMERVDVQLNGELHFMYIFFGTIEFVKSCCFHC